MEMSAAQATSVVASPAFMSVEEIRELERVVDEHRARCGTEWRWAEDGRWHVVYLHTDGVLRECLPHLADRALAVARATDAAQGWGLLPPHVDAHVRVAEYHEMKAGGCLGDPHHFDQGSLVTVDVMLARPGEDFDGGALSTLQPAGGVAAHAFERQGDALVFVAHKKHHVTPVTRGTRRVFVVEVWDGVERTCAHRCERPRGACDATVEKLRQRDEEDFADALFASVGDDVLSAVREAAETEAREEAAAARACPQ